MNKKLLISSVFLAVMAMPFSTAIAADKDSAQDKVQTKEAVKAKEQVYGSQLMTRQERTIYRGKMRNAKTEQEREQIRNQHHEEMKVRAKERGVTLPDTPPAAGAGMGPGAGMGGGGMGGGAGR